MQRQSNRFVLFASIAFLTFAEAFFTHLGSLRSLAPNPLERLHLGVLAALDLLAALGAGIVTAALTRFLQAVWISRGVLLTLIGLLGYALFRVWTALFVLPDAARPAAWGMALLYLGMAALVWRTRR